jgi:uncharacterized protein YuzE
MQLEFDLNVGALYIRLSGQPVASTREYGDNANVDFDQDQHIVGIEVISAAHQWPLGEILRRHTDIDPASAAQLVAYFTPGRLPSVAQGRRETVPVITAEPTPPTSVLVPA